MASDDINSKLKNEGWNICQEFLQAQGYQNVHAAINSLLNTDLKHAGISCLSTGDSKEKSKLSSPLVLQVTNVRNVAAPKVNEESQFAPRMLRITLTDGKGFIQGLEMDHISSLSLKIAPGTKIKIVSKVSYLSGYYLLKPSNITVLGGVVSDLYDKWKLSKEALKYIRGKTPFDGSGPPPWVPFGKGIVSTIAGQRDDFKALAEVESKPKDDKFQESRSEVVTKLSQEGSSKVFGGGKQMRDTNVQKIVNAGFTTEQAEEALCRNRNNLDRAFRQLKRSGEKSEEEEEESSFGHRGGRGRGGRRQRGRGGGRRKRDVSGPDASDDEGYGPPSARPSGPASLCDFLDLKSTSSKNAPTGDLVYQQQLMELNRYSKNNDCLQSKDSSYAINWYNRDQGGSQFDTFFSDQNSQRKNSTNTYDNRRESDSYRGNRHNRGSSNYETRKNARNYHDNDRPAGHYDSGKRQNADYQSDRYNNRGSSSYHSYDGDYDNYQDNQYGKAHAGGYQDKQYGKEGYQDNQYGRGNRGRYQDGNRQTSNYRGNNYSKRGSSNNRDNIKQSGNYYDDTYSKADTRGQTYDRGSSNYGRRNSSRRGNTSSDRGLRRGNTSSDRGLSSYGAQQSRNNESSKRITYDQEYPATIHHSSNYKSQQQHNTYGNQPMATGSSKKMYSQTQQDLIGQFRQSLEISGDYQAESRRQMPKSTGDYYREEKTQSQRRNQYGSTVHSGGNRGQTREDAGYRGAYYDGY